MTTEDIAQIDNTEAPRLLVESEKNNLESLREELYGTSKDVISSYKRYSRIRSKLAAKESVRTRAKLTKAEAELGMYIDAYNSSRNKVQTSLVVLIEVHDSYVSELHLSGDISAAKKAARAMDSYTKRIERFIDKVNDSVACIASHYALCIRAKEEEKEPALAEEIAYDVPKTVPNTTYVHSNEVEISPVSINIGPTVERAVERAITELSDALDKRISETLSTVELPAGNTADAAAVLDAAERVSTAAKALSEVLADLDTVIADVGAMVEKCRNIVEMQRGATREMQGIEVKQKLVNQEQTALIEAQEIVLQHQRIISEKHASISEAQSLSADAVAKIIESQTAIDSSLKDSIKAQKSLLKQYEKLNKQTESTEEDTNG